MAVNRNHSKNGGPTVDNGESVLKQCKDVELSFSDVSHKFDVFKGSKKGILLLTPYRMIFVTKGKDPMLSFMMPFYLVKGCSVEQPVFSANHIKGTIHAEAGGGWEGQATFKLTFNSGGAIEFGQMMFKVATNAPRGPPVRNNDFGYTPVPGGYTSTHGGYAAPPGGCVPAPGGYAPAPGGYAPAPGGYAPAPGGYAPAPGGYAPAPGGYAPAPGGYAPAPGGYAPAPGGYSGQPANGSYPYGPPAMNGYGPAPHPMGYPYAPPTDMYPPPLAMNPMYMPPPPPYSGPSAPSAPSAPTTWTEPGLPGGSKAVEAATSAYYNPANPHNVYMPMDQPPPYAPHDEKKNN